MTKEGKKNRNMLYIADRQQHPASNGRFFANVFTQRQKDAFRIQDYDLH